MESKEHLHLKKIGQLKLVRMGFWVVYPEVYADYCCGRLDAVGANFDYYSHPKKITTCGIEVKVSIKDYFSSKQKYVDAKVNSNYTKESELGVNYKYFLVPKGLIGIKDLYNGWGLMEFDGKRIKIIVEAPKKEVDNNIVLYEMAKIPLELYHSQKTKLRFNYDWKGYCDL